MDLRQCYDTFSGDYDGVMGRLLSEERVKKFLRMFVCDESFSTLCSALESGDYETAFRAAHTLKGTCANLGITALQNSASEITEALRGGVNNGADALLQRVKDDYDLTIGCIELLN